MKRKFKAPYLTRAHIEVAVENLRLNCATIQKTPVDVLNFAEFDLELEFEHSQIQQLGLDAVLRPDLTGIIFDNSVFVNPALLYRLRFSAAHELGHYFLHKHVYGRLNFKTVKQWMRFIEEIPTDQYQWMEWQANEFAGYLLMPSASLRPAIQESVEDAKREGIFTLGPEAVLDHCCRSIHQDFEVSRQAIQTRIRNSPFWPHQDVVNLPGPDGC